MNLKYLQQCRHTVVDSNTSNSSGTQGAAMEHEVSMALNLDMNKFNH